MKWIYLLSLFLLTSACSPSVENEQASESTKPPVITMADRIPSTSYEAARVAAVAAIKRAADKDYAWSTSDALLKQAQAVAAEGDEDRAIQLADEARALGDLAAKQADIEEAAWRGRVLSD